MPTHELTDLSIKGLKPHPTKQVDYRDKKVTGLIVRVSPKGTKTFCLWYVNKGGEARRLTLGRYGIVTLGDARKRAREALAQVAGGADPVADKQLVRATYETKLFPVVAADYVAIYAKPRQKDWAETERLLNREFVQFWSKQPITAIKREDVHACIMRIYDRGSHASANHAFATVRGMFNWAVRNSYLTASPCQNMIAPAPTVERDRVLSDHELVQVWNAAARMGYPYGPCIHLLMLTGQRKQEVAGMAWNELDLDKAQWTLPKERTKSARSQVVPLNTQALSVLSSIGKTSSPLVFPAVGSDRPISGFSKWKKELDAIAGLDQPWRVHDLRRSVATGLANLGTAPHIIQRVLNHVSGPISGVAAIYNRAAYQAETTKALVLWGDFLHRQLV